MTPIGVILLRSLLMPMQFDAAENSFAAPDLNDWVLWVSVKAMMK